MSDEPEATGHGGNGGHAEADEDLLEIPEIDDHIDLVLVPVDGSPGSERSLAYASLVAGATGARLVVVVAYDPPIAIRRKAGLLEVQHERTEMEQEASELAEEAVALLTARGHSARGIVVRGDPAEAIIEIAERESPDLIVIGRRGLGRLNGLLVGSVSERVARHADTPVLLV
jgi:nucleotide-binding universal stress UspA family protein